MPYKDPQEKRDWELRHRSQRIARRRELRQIEAAWKEAHPEAAWLRDSGAGFLLPIVTGGALAAYSPKLAMGTGAITLLVAARYKKGWSWWVVGLFILVLGWFFYWREKEGKK
jgi:hypothetical protein